MDNNISEVIKKYEEGLPVFKKLFKLKSEPLKEKLKDILGNDCNGILAKNTTVKKITHNDEPYEILIYYYDSIKIHPLGIDFIGEHAYTSKKLITFNKYFKL